MDLIELLPFPERKGVLGDLDLTSLDTCQVCS